MYDEGSGTCSVRGFKLTAAFDVASDDPPTTLCSLIVVFVVSKVVVALLLNALQRWLVAAYKGILNRLHIENRRGVLPRCIC